MEKIRIIVADDHVNVRRGLRKMLNRSPQVEVIGEAGNGREALELAKTLNPDVLLLDVEMPGMKGYEVARQLMESEARVRVLALSGYNEMHYVLGMFASGAAGYLTKDEAPRQLLSAVQEIAAGRRGWISPEVAKMLGVPNQPTLPGELPAMTKLELKILKSLAAGKTNLEIGKELELENSVVVDNIKSIIGKLGVRSRLEAVLRAIQQGLI
jgi:DNA-binding NarL/FixJ family response regulator